MKDFTRQNKHGGNDIVPALIDAMLGAGIDVANDFVLIYDASTGNMVKTTIGQLFLATGWNPADPGTIDNVVIGGVTPLAGTFTDLAADSLVVGGALDVGIMRADVEISASGTLAAAGSNQSGAAQILKTFTVVTGADDAKGVRLPLAADGAHAYVKNASADKTLLLYPGANHTIDGAASNAPLSIAAGVGVSLITDNAGSWYTV